MKKPLLLLFSCFTFFLSHAQQPFITTWEVTAGDLDITIPTNTDDYTYDYTVDFGDGTVLTNQTGNVTHTYSTAGVYTVSITGTFPHMYHMFDGSFGNNLNSVEQWGDNQWLSMKSMFRESTDMVINATDIPDLSQVTDLSYMFYECYNFNTDINNWDVSSVTNMDNTFGYAINFNQQLDNWDVSNVTNMEGTFYEAYVFNQNINNWNVSNVNNMKYMFHVANAFDQPLDNWDVSNVTDMTDMFRSAENFNQNINSWDVSSVTEMTQIFYQAYDFNQPLDNWDISNLEDLSFMFYEATSFNQNINSWDVSNVSTMFNMFFGASSFNQPLNDWDVSNVSGFGGMFSLASSFNQPLDNWEVWNANSMNSMFTDSNFNQDISNWCVEHLVNLPVDFAFNSPLQSNFFPNWGNQCSITNPDFVLDNNGITCLCPNADFGDAGTLIINGEQKTFVKRTEEQLRGIININNTQVASTCTTGITDMNGLFESTSFNKNIENWDVSNVTDMSRMFFNSNSFNHNLNNWNVSNVQNMSEMFADSDDFDQPLDNWDVSNVTDMSSMFENHHFYNHNLESWNVSNVITMERMFNNTSSFNQPLNNWDVSNVTDMGKMFNNGPALNQNPGVFNQPLDNWNVSNVNDMNGMFENQESFNQNIESWDVSNVVNMSRMFARATVFNQPLNNWNISNVTDLSEMFSNYLNTFSAIPVNFNQPLNNWDTSNVTNMFGLFEDNQVFNQPLINWDTSNVTNMKSMFDRTKLFNQELTNWDTSSVTDMSFMFYKAEEFNKNINNWITSNVTSMRYMFHDAISYNQPLNNLDVSNVIDFNGMFGGAENFNQPLNNWDISNATNIGAMFYNAPAFNQDIGNWDISNVNIFYDGIGQVSSFSDGVFENATNFNQDISNWNFNTYFLVDLISNSGMSRENYDLLLDKLVTYNVSNGTLDADNIQYCNTLARQSLTSNGWDIDDQGLDSNCTNNILSGKVIYDIDNNGCDINDPLVLNTMINITSTNYDTSFWVNFNGEYLVNLGSGNYTVALQNLDSSFTPTPSSHAINFSGQNETQDKVDFCVIANQQITDLSVDIFPLDDAISGSESTYQIIVSNNGTQAAPNAQVTFGFNSGLQTYVSSTLSSSSSTSNLLTFDLTNIQPFSNEIFEITMLNLSSFTSTDDILNFTVEVTPNSNDSTPEDGTVSFVQQIANSFDPNDKMVVQGDQIVDEDIDQYLDYRIRFQNLGTANALNVKITDTIDNNLDWTTFQPITSSHDYRIEIVDGEQINYYFDNINLPFETADPEASNGYITYKIKPKPSVQIGDTFENTAYIYFDFNQPIITNTVVTMVVNNLSADTFDFNRIKIYPNPVNDKLYLDLPYNLHLNSINLYDIQGKLIKTFEGNFEMNFNNIPQGIYILKLETNQGYYHDKIIKQ